MSITQVMNKRNYSGAIVKCYHDTHIMGQYVQNCSLKYAEGKIGK